MVFSQGEANRLRFTASRGLRISCRIHVCGGASEAVYFAYSSCRTFKSFRKALTRSSDPFGRRSQSASNFVILGFWVGKSRLPGCSSTSANVSGSSPTTAVTAAITPFIWQEESTIFGVVVFVFSAVFFHTRPN